MGDIGLLSWEPTLWSVALPIIVLGCVLTVIVALRPKTLWPLLIVTAILGSGPKVLGYVILDEAFAGFLLLGALVRVGTVGRSQRVAGSGRVQPDTYLLWMGYMLIQSGVGLIVNDDVRLFRFVFLYLLLAAFWLIIRYRRREFPFPQIDSACAIVCATTSVYLAAYVWQGMFFESQLGYFGRFMSQDYFWAGSAAATFPLVIGVPAALRLLNDRVLNRRALAWLVMALTMWVGFYFYSRIVWIVLLGMVAISWRQTNALRIAALCAVFAAVAGTVMDRGTQTFESIFRDLAGTSITSPQESDARSRMLQLHAGVNTALAGSGSTLIFGAGMYSHRYLMVPSVRELLSEYPTYGDFTSDTTSDGTTFEIVRTTGLPAMLVDTGVIGVLLMVASVLPRLWATLQSRAPTRSSMAAAIVMAVLWLLVSNILDIVLFYLLLMPSGLVDQWTRAELEARVDAEERGRKSRTFARRKLSMTLSH